MRYEWDQPNCSRSVLQKRAKDRQSVGMTGLILTNARFVSRVALTLCFFVSGMARAIRCIADRLRLSSPDGSCHFANNAMDGSRTGSALNFQRRRSFINELTSDAQIAQQQPARDAARFVNHG